MPVDIHLLRSDEGIQLLKSSQRKRFRNEEYINELVSLDKEISQLRFSLNQKKKSINDAQKQLSVYMKAKDNENLEIEKLKETIKDLIKTLKLTITTEETLFNQKVNELNTQFAQIGNLVHDSVPGYYIEEKNRIIKTWGDELKKTVKYYHHELIKMIDGYETTHAVEICGHRGYFLKGICVLLNQALINYGLNFLSKKTYTALQPPFFMRKTVMSETAQLEQFDEELYKVTGNLNEEEMYLIATSEQPISAYHRNDVLNKNALPIRYAGLSTCFRKEAGAAGKDVTGIFRTHQFDKVEQFVISSPDQSWTLHEEMIAISEEFYQSLKLPYQIVNIVSGALNNAAAKKYDLEAWFPRYGGYRELVSASNCTDYQSRALNIRYGVREKDSPPKYVHMLNATLCATQRTMCCILENYQTDEGIMIPEVLRKYMDGLEVIPWTYKS